MTKHSPTGQEIEAITTPSALVTWLKTYLSDPQCDHALLLDVMTVPYCLLVAYRDHPEVSVIVDNMPNRYLDVLLDYQLGVATGLTTDVLGLVQQLLAPSDMGAFYRQLQFESDNTLSLNRTRLSVLRSLPAVSPRTWLPGPGAQSAGYFAAKYMTETYKRRLEVTRRKRARLV